ncbi:hypothetical protein UlMin_009013 [Ulmus minor]
MAPSKSPGADGMSALFYQKYWHVVGDEVVAACLGVLNEGIIILEEQSAFILGRLISNNAIIGFECLHVNKRSRLKKRGCLALKLDMTKAFDRVEWSFFQGILFKLGFSEAWIRQIMACVTSVSYSFLINGTKFGQLIPTRGLRQGDPLSPYLFLFCAEGLSSLFHHFEAIDHLQGMRCGQNGPTISHLFFVDNSLLFFEASTNSCLAIKEALT